MASSSSTFSSVAAHGRHSYLPLSIVHSLNSGITLSDLIYCSEIPEQPSWGNYPGLPAQVVRYADPFLGDVENNSGADSVQIQQISGSVTVPNESDDGGAMIRYLGDGAFDDILFERTGTLDDIIPTDIPADNLHMAGSPPVSAPPNYKTCQNMAHQSVPVPSNSQQLYPTLPPEYPPANANIFCPKRTKVRMRWTVEMHDRFIDAIKELGDSENAKPKAILDIMKVEGLTRSQVKSHLQKYKLAKAKHQASEGISAKMTGCSEAFSSSVQLSIEALALQVQMDLQKKLHEMLVKTYHDLEEIHKSMLERHAASINELEKRRKLSTDPTAPFSDAAGCSRRVHGDGSSAAATDADAHASEAGSQGDNAGA